MGYLGIDLVYNYDAVVHDSVYYYLLWQRTGTDKKIYFFFADMDGALYAVDWLPR